MTALHCTNHYPYFLMKFAFGVVGLLVMYIGYLKESDVTCLCGARKREWERSGRQGRPERCYCKDGFRRTKVHACGCIATAPEGDYECIKNRASEGGCCGKLIPSWRSSETNG